MIDVFKLKAMDLDNEKQKKKQRKVVKRKSVRKKSRNVEQVTDMVDSLKVHQGPSIVIEETRSQPGSRRNSSLAPEEMPRRSSNVGILTTKSQQSSHPRKDSDPSLDDGSTRRASVKRGSLFEDEEDLEAKKIKAALTAMGLLKKKQKAFTWDTNTTKQEKIEDVKNKWKRPAKAMDKDKALKTLGFTDVAGKVTKPRDIRDYSEEEILVAFQGQCKHLSKYLIAACHQ